MPILSVINLKPVTPIFDLVNYVGYVVVAVTRARK